MQKNFSKIFQLTRFNGPLIFAGGVIITFLGVTSLYGCVKDNQNVIHQYEQSGDYATALRLARSHYEAALQMGPSHEETNYSHLVKRLEHELLTLGSSRLLFDENYQPRVKFLKLLELIDMEPLSKSEKAILQINKWAQKHLLSHGERWQEQESKYEQLKPIIKPLLRELGFVDLTQPHFREYQGAIVHGALLSTVRLRLHYLVDQWKQGVRFSQVYFLSGERPLEPSKENKTTFTDDSRSLLKIRKNWTAPLEFPKTESEMTKLVWEQSDIPENMRKAVKVHFINAPMKKDPKSEKWVRPTTDDTVEAWLKDAPPHGRYLAITNAPYTNRQDLVVRAIAPKEYSFDTVGSGASEQEKIAIFLDELARYIFQMKQITSHSKNSD